MQSVPRVVLAFVTAALSAAIVLAQQSGVPADRVAAEKQATVATPQAKVGQPAPSFELLDCTGTKHSLSDYRDKVVVLEWLNQQCPWSVQAIPVMKELRKKYAGRGIVWLGIESTHYRKAEENVQYAKDKELDFPILLDSDGHVGKLYGAKTTPHVFVIDKGTLVYAGALHNNQHGEKKGSEVRNYLDEALQAVLAGKAVPLSETTPWGCTIKYKPEKEKAQ